ncbi:elongation factor Ts [Fontibacillus solani]|uniref:Elongation factor Ts n=1 Tax=Fontibacillus solani TaxID=1572857 RepID=A0A7W3SQ84_9BACL|nr:translation elongation factor Ts [Fontibacillus solani]MBA9084250.1 elongation factor Ts [Fontibacillus solani]
MSTKKEQNHFCDFVNRLTIYVLVILLAVNGDLEQSITYLREKGISTAVKKAGRVAAEGLVHAYINDNQRIGVLLEVNCETDFVAKTSEFKAIIRELARLIAIENPIDLNAVDHLTMHNGETVGNVIKSLTTTLGERILLKRFTRYEVCGHGMVASYIHEDYLTEGKLGVLVEVQTDRTETLNQPQFISFVKSMVMHIAAERPTHVSMHESPSEVVLAENCLIEQNLINGSQKKIETIIEELNMLMGQENDSDKPFWLLSLRKGLKVAKAEIEWAEECITELES